MVNAIPDHPLKILHLEDSLADHGLAKTALRRSGMTFTLQHVDTLDAFQTLTTSEPFDIILADYHLAGFTALDAWRHVAQLPQHPPFVLLSGAIGETAAVDAMRLGIADYLSKDDMVRLPHVMARAIEVHEARRMREHAIAELAASQRHLADLTEHLQTSIERERGKSTTISVAPSQPCALISPGSGATPMTLRSRNMPRLRPTCCSMPLVPASAS